MNEHSIKRLKGLVEQCEQIIILKNLAVKSECFDIASEWRDIEKKVQGMIADMFREKPSGERIEIPVDENKYGAFPVNEWRWSQPFECKSDKNWKEEALVANKKHLEKLGVNDNEGRHLCAAFHQFVSNLPD